MADVNVNRKKNAKCKPRGKPFETGNKLGGRKPIPQEFKELAESHSIEALQTAINIMKNEDYKTADRLKAVEIVLERGIGKAIQAIDLESKNDSVIRIIMDGDLESWAK